MGTRKPQQMDLPLEDHKTSGTKTTKTTAYKPDAEVILWIARLLPEAMTWDKATATKIAQTAKERLVPAQPVAKAFNIARMTVALERICLLDGIVGGLEGQERLAPFPELRFVKDIIRLRHVANLL
jgi:hypothetical protein